ncbi:hypothetical protein B0J13DRAFT_547571 [Dactylonectria estremocensis]|uniref:U4/U6.U5 small nuclear ribonucleoprotein 27kDa protein domain-containing protein n=1 Tax=Dactylonectria estremocensis TaxID=1079267 RepID=A0A9P9JB12_9HYPO|nr:hypothetical protein B0J13DRAFT_547571 [Dactylonectria estremocensis]
MADSRRRHRPDSRQMWDESDRRDRGPGQNNRDRDSDRRGYRDRSPNSRSKRSYDRRGGHRDRSRSPDRRPRDGDTERSGPSHGRRDGPRHFDDRDRSDRRRNDDDGEGAPRQRREDDRDRRGRNQRSASPRNRSLEPALPTRTKPDGRKATPHMSFNVAPARDGSQSPRPEQRGREREGAAASEGEASDDDMELEVDDDAAAMQAMMGFGGFGTTKNKKVAGNNVGGVKKEKKLEYRQYMNRQGGFNRPLSPSR